MSTCSQEGCAERAIARGWCQKHYQRWRRHGDVNTVIEVKKHQCCEYPGCEQPHQAGGLCVVHYGRCRRAGSERTVGALRSYEVAEAYRNLLRTLARWGVANKE